MDNITNDDLKWLLQLLEQENLAEIEVSVGDSTVVLKAASAQAIPIPMIKTTIPAGPSVAPLPENVEKILAPMAGIFYRASSPEAPAYAEIGDEMQIGDTVALIEAMKLYNEVTSHIHGRIVGFLVENEAHVEADQPLVLIERTTQ